jgi:hypothetical protein
LEAATIGLETLAVVEELLADPLVDRTPAAAKVVKLAHKAEIGQARLEAACKRARSFGEAKYLTIKRILAQELEQLTETQPKPPPVAAHLGRYTRSSSEIFQRLFVVGLTFVSTVVTKLWN